MTEAQFCVNVTEKKEKPGHLQMDTKMNQIPIYFKSNSLITF